MNAFEKRWSKEHGKFGLEQEWLGKSFKDMRFGTCIIKGLVPRTKINPVLVESEEGTLYQFDELVVKCIMEHGELVPGIVLHHMEICNVFRDTQTSINNRKDMLEVAESMCGMLSPENLFADGERPRKEAYKLRDDIMKAVKWIERKIGEPIDVYQLNPDA